jgi:hypothetical protein
MSNKCEFEVKITLNPPSKAEISNAKYITIMLAVQAFDDENTLFEGISEKIIT